MKSLRYLFAAACLLGALSSAHAQFTSPPPAQRGLNHPSAATDEPPYRKDGARHIDADGAVKNVEIVRRLQRPRSDPG